ncbi:MAG: bifunctional riboflavin kinase/FAD synthetase [Gammaproteobacteria bacterium]
MEFIRGLHNIRARHRGCVATIGNFDGLHLGHQAVIRQLHEVAADCGLPAAVVIFEPQPQEFLAPDRAPARLMRLRDKIEWLARHDADRLLCLRFNRGLAECTPRQFVERVLVAGLAVKHLIVGDDFRFGKNREGGYDTLVKLAGQSGYQVDHTTTCAIEGGRVSSTRVREALASGDMQLAARLLGRPYAISGRVIHGDKRGRELGYPTINMDLHRLRSPVVGIFVSRVHGLGTESSPAVTSVGNRPMFAGTRMLVETHLLDYAGDAYGANIQVELLQKLREEEMFRNNSELQQQIERDIAMARKYFEKQ